jgi:adenine deaminase
MNPRNTSRLFVLSLLALAICAFAALSFAPTTLAQGGEPRFFAIKDTRIVPVAGPVIEKGTVVVADGLIKAVGADVAIPPEALVIDGTGLTIYPGLIDSGA